jgi:hypothetical protein
MQTHVIKTRTHNMETKGWDDASERQALAWIKIADLNSATNELAALYYVRLHKIALIFISILTVAVGGSGISAIITSGASASTIVFGICEIALGITAALLSNMELKTKGETFSKRSVGYNKLASTLRVQHVLQRHERANKSDFLQSIPERVEILESMAEPLPTKYRKMASLQVKHELGTSWGASSREVISPPDTSALPVVSVGRTAIATHIYDPRSDIEGSILSIIEQRI